MSDLQDFRDAKDEFLCEDELSPVPHERRKTFPGLSYYEENPALVFEVAVERLEEPETVALALTSGDSVDFERWARVRFQIDGEAVELSVFRDEESGALFLPFLDAGAGIETHPGGRYLEPVELANGRLHLDFNYAYNPFCAFNDTYACPIPPEENHVKVGIRAGERIFRGA